MGRIIVFFLDGAFKGVYPQDIVELYKKYNPDFVYSEEDMLLMKNNHPDFIGINYYAPSYVRFKRLFPFKADGFLTNPDTIKMFNGPVRPDYLYKLLVRLKEEYDNPAIYITENGAGFGATDEVFVNGVVNDSLRASYIKRHVEAMMRAKKDGVNVKGYMVWSMFDNFEWVFGYDRRFGIVHVDFETQKRTPKKSFYEYQQIIKTYGQ